MAGFGNDEGRFAEDQSFMRKELNIGEELLSYGLMRFGTILADPPWRFANRTGKMAPEHKRLSRYSTMTLQEIMELPVSQLALPQSHLYLWVPNALISEGLDVMKRWVIRTKPILFGTKYERTGGLVGEASGFTFAM
jgi:N6-adenosine-specific RNA methylase IME4